MSGLVLAIDLGSSGLKVALVDDEGRVRGSASAPLPTTFTPDGGDRQVFATGLRNCSGLAVQPDTGAPWCVTNERDQLGDNLPPDFATHLEKGAFYGWPWFYIGNHEDPRAPLKDQRPDLASRVTAPDVLIQAHSAPLGIAFYQGTMFPAEYRDAAIVAEHGSWNRSKKSGYKVVAVRFDGDRAIDAKPLVDGFEADEKVSGRPADVLVMPDGSLLIADDHAGAVYRLTYGAAAATKE